MLRILRRLFRKTAAVDAVAIGTDAPTRDPLAVYGLPAERVIFHYHDGARPRSIDPLVAWEVLVTFPDFDPTKDFPAAIEGDRESLARCFALTCAMFDVIEYDGETGIGLTRDELRELLNTFLDYLDDVKKKRAALPTVSPPTAWTLSPPAAADSTTLPASDSCSTPSASTDAELGTPLKRSIHL